MSMIYTTNSMEEAMLQRRHPVRAHRSSRNVSYLRLYDLSSTSKKVTEYSDGPAFDTLPFRAHSLDNYVGFAYSCNLLLVFHSGSPRMARLVSRQRTDIPPPCGRTMR